MKILNLQIYNSPDTNIFYNFRKVWYLAGLLLFHNFQYTCNMFLFYDKAIHEFFN